MDVGKLTLLFIFCIALTGCIGYQPKPLNDTILTKNEILNKNTLIDKAAKLHHPRIPAIQLDFSKPLTAQELAVIAVLLNSDLKALRAKEGVAQAQVFEAGLLPDPQLSIAFDHPLYQTNPPTIGLTNAYNLGLSWDIIGIITRHLKLKKTQTLYQQTHYDVAWQEWLIANQAELLATRIYYLKQQLHLAQQATLSAKRLLDVTQSNLQRHDARIDELGLRQSTYLDLQDQTQTLNRALLKTQAQLNQTLGLYPYEEVSIGIKNTTIPPHLNANDVYNEARLCRLDFIALRAGYASEEAQLYQAVLGQFPHFNLGISRARDVSDINTAGINLSFDLPLFNRNRGVIAIAQATRDQLYQEYIARLHQTQTDIAILVTDLNQIRKAKMILALELPSMRKTEQLMHHGLKEGNITLIAYEDMRASLFNKELKLLLLQQDAAEQMIALQIAQGKLLSKETTDAS
jgi:cobalt-zinc-cadmium efflux system outer membrane protein